MGSGEEENFGSSVDEPVPMEGMDWVGTVIAGRQMRMQIFKEGGCAGVCLACASQEGGGGLVQPRMVQQETCEFAAGVPADARDGDAWGV
jgi:hypothetical protein